MSKEIEENLNHSTTTTPIELKDLKDSKNKKGVKKEQVGFNNAPNPLDTANPFSILTFGWAERFAYHCFKNVLEQSHLWDLANFDRSTVITSKVQVQWKKELEKPKQSYWKAAVRAFGPYYCISLLFYSLSAASQFVGPQLLSRMIKFVAQLRSNVPDINPNMGYYYAVAMFGSAMIGSFCLYQANMAAARVGNWMRSGIVCDIYNKSLKLDTSARSKTSPGEVVNIMSNDAQRIAEVFLLFNNGLFAPLQIIVCIALMYLEIGWPTFVGLGIMVLMAPVNAITAKRLLALRFAMVKNSDKRLRSTTEILQAIKIIKLYSWEDSFAKRIQINRGLEVKALAKFSYFRAGLIFVVSAVPTIVSVVVFSIVFKVSGLQADKIFSALAYLNILKLPLSFLPLTIAMMAQVKVATDRVTRFLLLSERTSIKEPEDLELPAGLYVKDANLVWLPEKEDSFKLNNISFTCNGPSLTMVVGSVGSGKSSLCQSLLGDMTILQGDVHVRGKIAYVSQQAWIINASLRQNVLYGAEYNEERYNRIIQVCALNRDIEMFPEGDLVEIGERGINVSGGQKQRISLARAVYNDADIYILDDPLSAVDAHVGKHLFQQCIAGILKEKTVLLVANQLNYLPFATNVLVMSNNTISERGTYQELLKSKKDFSLVLENYGMGEFVSNSLSNSPSTLSLKNQQVEEVEEKGEKGEETIVESPKIQKDGKLIIKEERETGSVGLKIYWKYFSTGGILLFLFVLLLFLLEIGSRTITDWWLSAWSNAEQFPGAGSFPITTDQYLYIYIGIGLGSIILSGARNFIFFSYTVRCAIVLHDQLFKALLRAPMWVFDTTPMGRIINRFTRDQDVVDNLIAPSVGQYISLFFSIIASLVIISIITPFLLVPLAPIIFIYYGLQFYYRHSSRELQRLVSISRSPIFSHFTETLHGASTIRAYRREEESVVTNYRLLDDNNKSYIMLQTMNQWLGLRLDFLGNLLIFFAALFIVIDKSTISIANVGLSLSYALSITGSLNRATLQAADTETKMNSVERITHYIKGPVEAPQIIPNCRPSPDWPSQGGVVFDNVVMRYREGLDPVLKGITCNINPKEKIGIVGRTGSGKSSVVLCLFRLVELASGTISLDGQDISQYGLKDLRKNLSIIPQDPVLFSGTLRENLDPFNETSDEFLWEVLNHIQLFEKSKSLQGGLDSTSCENFSLGERQLICLGRALVRKPKILVLDEATASVDSHSDSLIQKTIQEQFTNCTIITIAHRLNTIIDYDRILVMDSGKIVEFDTPHQLLQNPNGQFTWLVDETGEQNSQLLKKLASEKYSL